MKETFYFSHDYNARNDPKILMLRGEFGNEGYALYFYILETMAEDTNGVVNREAIGGLSIGYGVAKEILSKFIDFCVNIKLFKENNTGIYSQRMLEHKNIRKLLSDKGKEGANKRWENREAIGEAISTPNAKERKGKERKENTNMSKEDFAQIWLIYPNKKNRKKAEDKFLKLDKSLLTDILNGLQKQILTPDWKKDNGQFVPHLTTWLNGERWKDEIKGNNLSLMNINL
jgi:hypothetical protein